jgi:hypothetical protein
MSCLCNLYIPFFFPCGSLPFLGNLGHLIMVGFETIFLKIGRSSCMRGQPITRLVSTGKQNKQKHEQTSMPQL